MFLGTIRSGEYEEIEANGYRLGVILDKSRNATLPGKSMFDISIHFDFSKSREQLLAVIQSIQREYNILALMNMREAYVSYHAFVSQKLGYPSLDEQCVQLVTNKTDMRTAFIRKLGEGATAAFESVGSETVIKTFADKVGLPIVIKPNGLAASLFIQKIWHAEKISSIYSQAINAVQKYMSHYGMCNSHPNLIQVEEYLEGSVHSIDAIITAEEKAYPTPIVDVMTGNDLGQNDFHHFMRSTPSKLAIEKQVQATGLALAGIAALKMKSCIAHVEFIQTAKGPKLLEIAARPGAHRNHLLEKTYGISLNFQFLKALLGLPFDLKEKFQRHFAIVTPFPREVMSFSGIKNFHRVIDLPSYKYHDIKATVGEKIGPASRGFYSCFNIELESPDAKVLEKDVKTLKNISDFF